MSSVATTPPELPLTTGLVGLGALAATCDAATTWLGMQVAAADATLTFTELNPAMHGLIAGIGAVGAMTLRVVAGVVLLLFLSWTAGRSRWRWWPLAAATVLTWGVVAWNLTNLYAVVV